ncbi:MAG: cofactor-independent phosphoglycerate mutase [Dysgonamonadaceae bacterium]|jgi:2,3-bisphosphoglycerate-independent phosphoglycerate mutase|nr:cofactor-independent phosphoglycerate mutase [Dysgonamonadaceae bacterium]
MKYIIILADGMADEPIPALGGKTPLQAVATPYIDRLARLGCSGLLDTIPPGYVPGSEIANLSVLGYHLPDVFEGRGSLEAASMGVEILPNEMVMRCNLICIQDEKIKSHSAGHISNQEAEVLICFLNEHLQNERLSFYPGVSYRHLLKLRAGDKRLICTPPHDVPGTLATDVLIKAEVPEAQATADYLNHLIMQSWPLLENHPINLQRKADGKLPANSIWPWSPGYKPSMKKMTELFPIRSGAVISAVDLIKGIGIYAGLESIDVPGATGLYNTNYEGKTQAALAALQTKDFVFLHIEASDEAGHEGDVELKMKTIDYLEKRVVQPIWEAIQSWKEPVTIALLPDHPTPCHLRTHTRTPVPFVICKPGQTPDNVSVYDEFAAAQGSYGLLKGAAFMQAVFKNIDS